MKNKLILIMFLVTLFKSFDTIAQQLPNLNNIGTYTDTDESKWNIGNGHEFTMNYTLFGKSYANGVWQGALGYGTGMWLSGNKTEWGIIGSILAVNVPILFDGDYDKEEVWVGKNLGAMTISFSVTFAIEKHRNGKLSWNVVDFLKKR